MPDRWRDRLALAKRTVPHFYQTVECKMDALLKLQAGLGDPAVQPVDFVALALARLLRQMPLLNSRWDDDATIARASVDIGYSTGSTAQEPVVIAEADRIGLRGIAARRVHGDASNLLAGSFMLLDLSALGIDQADAIVDPLTAGVLALGAVRERAVAESGEIKIAQTMRCTLSGDHRLVDGAAGAEFLAELRQRLENPLSLLL
jgi:pyruvate dehydrogenase E2 component (dihydrolipoamide acetyltransferase)